MGEGTLILAIGSNRRRRVGLLRLLQSASRSGEFGLLPPSSKVSEFLIKGEHVEKNGFYEVKAVPGVDLGNEQVELMRGIISN